MIKSRWVEESGLDDYEGDPEAMRLRTMHLAYEAVKQSGGTLVIPSAFSEGFVPEGGEKA